MIKTLEGVPVSGKRVLLRCDLDVPLTGVTVADDSRLIASQKTLSYLLEQGATVIVIGHLGRPDGEIKSAYSLMPVANWYGKGAALTTVTLGAFVGWQITDHFLLLENIRFYKGEEQNSEDFARQLAQLGDLYVDDAFAVSHRAHASTVGITKFLPSYAGFQLQKEIETLTAVIENPKRPLTVLLGGAKVETKLPLAKKMLTVADAVLVGGKIAKETDAFEDIGDESKLVLATLDEEGMDITEESAAAFASYLEMAQTIIWNGPVGKTEDEKYQRGSALLAKVITQTEAFSVVGGGDTIDFLKQIGLLSKFSFVSTGGGAMLQLLSGETLPAVASLEQTA